MDPTFIKHDYAARCIDNATYIVLGIAVILIAPNQIRRKLESGKITAIKAKSMSRIVWPMALLLILYGVFRIFFD